jgi:DprA/Smf-like nucleotide binding protein involved in DNA uptake
MIVSALGPSPVDIDELIRTTGIATRKVLSCCSSWIWRDDSSATASSSFRSRCDWPSLVRIGFLVIGLFQGHMDKISEEWHLSALSDHAQPLEH